MPDIQSSSFRGFAKCSLSGTRDPVFATTLLPSLPVSTGDDSAATVDPRPRLRLLAKPTLQRLALLTTPHRPGTCTAPPSPTNSCSNQWPKRRVVQASNIAGNKGATAKTATEGLQRPSILSMSQDSYMLKYAASPLLPPLHMGDNIPKLVVVFDLDETLISNRRPGCPAVVRPFAEDLLTAVSSMDGVEVVLWTASVAPIAQHVLTKQLDKQGAIFDHVICRDSRWHHEAGSAKDLSLLGRDINRTVIVENALASVRLNPSNAIMVPDFMGNCTDDNVLLQVKEVIKALADSTDCVGTVLERHPYVGHNHYVKHVPPGESSNNNKSTSRLAGELRARVAIGNNCRSLELQ